MAKGKLSERERRFVDAFMGPAAGVAAKAAILAGCPKPGARVQAHRLLTKANVQQAIAARAQKREQGSILTADERDLMLSRIAVANETVDPWISKAAVAELNKVNGRHSSTLHVKGKLDIETAVDQTFGRGVKK